MAAAFIPTAIQRLRKRSPDGIPIPDAVNFRPLTEEERREIREKVLTAGEIIPRSWPLGSFVYRNALQGFEHLPFEEAVREGRKWFGGRGYLPKESYRTLYREGRITEGALMESLRRSEWFSSLPETVSFGNQVVNTSEIVRIHLLYGIEAIGEHPFYWKTTQEKSFERYRPDVPERLRAKPEAGRIPSLWTSVLETLGLGGFKPSVGTVHFDDAAPDHGSDTPSWSNLLEDLAGIGKHRTLSDWIQNAANAPMIDPLNDLLIKWCSAFLDEGMAAWPMPSRHLGFYGTWRDLAPYDRSLATLGILDSSRRLRRLPLSSEETLAGCLTQTGLPRKLWADYLAHHLAMLPGWAGFIKWRAGESGYAWQRRHPIDLVDYLAVRLYYEFELAELTCQSLWGVPAHLPDLERYAKLRAKSVGSIGTARHANGSDKNEAVFRDAWRLFHLAQFLGLEPEALRQLSIEGRQTIFHLLDTVSEKDPGPVWLRALELSYRNRLLARLTPPSHESPRHLESRPKAQAVFCIDARSEVLRRFLERSDEYATYGFAGFFGIPIRYRPYGSAEEQLLCPAMIKPQQIVVERPRAGHKKEADLRDHRVKWHHLLDDLVHGLKENNFTAYTIIDFFGGFFGIGFLGKGFFPRFYQSIRNRLDHYWHPPVPTMLEIDRPAGVEADRFEARFGFSPEDQAGFVENGLRMIGLAENFARIVLFCAHGSTSENNPYAAAYDCGACGGKHGGPNARALAAMGNRPEVRQILAKRGMILPGDTLFLAGEHNTTTDTITMLDEETLPDSHQKEAIGLFKDLNLAGTFCARDRMARLPGETKAKCPEEASRQAEARSVDWSQVRPEWGLSSNAAFFIGRRERTAHVDLEGRVFLHSYDPRTDTDGRILETIMTAPLLVVQWISMEYYFSCVDSTTYGSGTKFLHNVVGGVGVMLGRSSDLRPGLPLQSVMNGEAVYHEPVRPLVIIEASQDRVKAVIEKHEVLKRLFENQWVHLLVMDPEDHSVSEFHPGRGWSHV